MATQATQQSIWALDPSHTLVEFSVRHMMVATVKGRFGGVQGNVVIDEESGTPVSVDVTIDAASVDTRDEKRDAHLRSADFFDVENHPHLTFKSTRIERVGDEQFTIVGDLTIRGTTREVTLDTTFNGRGTNPWGQAVAGASATTSVNRHDYGLSWNVALETGGFLVGDTIKISLEVELIKQG